MFKIQLIHFIVYKRSRRVNVKGSNSSTVVHVVLSTSYRCHVTCPLYKVTSYYNLSFEVQLNFSISGQPLGNIS